MAANYGDDDALGVCGGDIEAQLEQMRANTIETLRRELGFASDDAAVQDQDGTPTQDQSLAYAAPGQAPDSIFIGENGRGLTNDAARLLAGRQNRINTDGNIIYSAEEHGDPSLPNKWAMVGRKVANQNDTDTANGDSDGTAVQVNTNKDKASVAISRLSLGSSGFRQTGLFVKPDGTRVMVLDGAGSPASTKLQPTPASQRYSSGEGDVRDTTPAQGLQVDPATGLASFAYTSKALKQAEGGLVNTLAASVGGAAESFINMGLGTAGIAKNAMIQALDAATLGTEHDSPLAQQAWADQAALGTGIYNLAADPREAFDKMMQGWVNRYESAMAMDDDGDRSYALAKLFNDAGQGALGAGAMARGGFAKYGAMQEEARAAAAAAEVRRQTMVDNNFGADNGYDPKKISYFAMPGAVGKVTDFTHPYYYTGHVGYSFDNGGNIFGLAPYAPELMGDAPKLIRSLRNGDIYPGVVMEDREFFKDALNSDARARNGLGKQDVYKLDVPVTRGEFEQAQQLTRERGLKVPLPEFPYSFKTGGACTPPYNCATYPSTLGLPIPEDSGAVSVLVPKIIKEGATTWRPTR